jgi:diphosphomevalonate decarboxylase
MMSKFFNKIKYHQNRIFKPNSRQVAIINELANKFLITDSFRKLTFHIKSRNTFPTAAGCASSASGGACLVTALKGLFLNVHETNKNYSQDNKELMTLELSSLARRVSGSASRSVYDGFVEWKTSGEAECVFDADHWKNFRILLLLVSDKRKDYSSTDGMTLSKQTSEFLNYRVKNQVTPRLEELKIHLKNKDISGVCEIAMKESNSFHAVCRDTYPPLVYMNESSDFLIKCVNYLNNFYGENKKIICGYSFDAGPNCFIFTSNEHFENVSKFLNIIFCVEGFDIDKNLIDLEELSKKLNLDFGICKKLIDEKKMKNYRIEDIISFSPGKGSHLI